MGVEQQSRQSRIVVVATALEVKQLSAHIPWQHNDKPTYDNYDTIRQNACEAYPFVRNGPDCLHYVILLNRINSRVCFR